MQNIVTGIGQRYVVKAEKTHYGKCINNRAAFDTGKTLTRPPRCYRATRATNQVLDVSTEPPIHPETHLSDFLRLGGANTRGQLLQPRVLDVDLRKKLL